MACDGIRQRRDHRGISPARRQRRLVVRRAREPHHAAGSLDRELVLAHQHLGDLSLRGRPYSFRFRTSLIAAFSSARSAYMRFSFAFSASSSRSRLTSETDAPPYLLCYLKNVALLMPCFRSRSGTGNSAPAPSSALFQGSSAPCTGACGSRIPGILGNRLLSSGSTCARRRIALRVAAAVLGHLRVRRVDSVSTRHRSFLLASLLPAFLLVISASAVVQAQKRRSPAAKPARWSDPATWPDRRCPAQATRSPFARASTSSSTSVRRRWAV